MTASREVHYECTEVSSRPDDHGAVRWLDPQADYDLARRYWPIPLSVDEWLGFQVEGYEYAALVVADQIVSIAAIWRYSDDAWALSAVGTHLSHRRRGHAKSVCGFVTERILGSGRTATCTVMADNAAMRTTAEAVGYHRKHDGARAPGSAAAGQPREGPGSE